MFFKISRKEKSGWESVFQDIIRKTKENSQFRTNFIIAVLILFGVFCLVLIVAFTMCVYQLMRGKRARSNGGCLSLIGCAGGGDNNNDDDSGSSSSEWSSSETSVSQEEVNKPKKDSGKSANQQTSNKPSAMDENKMELGEKASVHSIADSLDVSLSNRHSSSLAEEFPSETPATTNFPRRYVNTKTTVKRVEEKPAPCDQENNKKEKETKSFHHNCKFANFTLKKTLTK